MTVQEMAQQLGVAEDSLNFWMKSVAVYVREGMTVEQAVERIHTLFTRLLDHARRETPEYVAWRTKLANEIWESANARQ